MCFADPHTKSGRERFQNLQYFAPGTKPNYRKRGNIKQLSDEVFVISGILKVEVSVFEENNDKHTVPSNLN